jgi:hypothetical protein
MTDTLYIEDESASEWSEIPRLEALLRLENMLNMDVVSFEVDADEADTGIGKLRTFTLLHTSDFDQKPVLLCMKDPIDAEKPARWFLHRDLVID